MEKRYTIAVAGTSYVGLSIVILLSQHHKVYAVDIILEKVKLINEKIVQFWTSISKGIRPKRNWI